MGKTVLVTGAGGFIGSHLTERLVRDGHRGPGVRPLQRPGRPRATSTDSPPRSRTEVEVHRGDLKDPEAVRKAVEGRDWVFHLGALIAIPYSYQNPHDVVQTNVLGTAHVLDACRASTALERVVLTSTSEVYGTAQYVPIDEKHPLRGQSPYAATKIGADALGESYHRAFGLPVAILRPFNTFGPRQSARAIIPTIISQALTRPVVRLGSLDPRRDLTYVKDTARASWRSPAATPALGRVVNIGRGEDVTIGELVERIGRPAGPADPGRDRRPTASAPPPARSAGCSPARPWPGSSGAGAARTRSTGARRDDRLGRRQPAIVPGRRVHDLSRSAEGRRPEPVPRSPTD